METNLLKQLVGLRHELHQNPELSGNELQTKKRIKEFLETLGVRNIKDLSDTAFVCEFQGDEPGPTVMIRGDIDALPIQEINSVPYKSISKGVSHKCGHDGHSTIVCGLAKALLDDPISKGTVLLLFQPAEENGEGAKAILENPKFNYKPNFVFALHNLPGYPLHHIVCREQSFTAAAKSIIITLDGKTSHAAEPEKGINPGHAISQLIDMFEEVSQPNPMLSDFALATPIYINMGDLAYGVSAGYGEVHYTLRTWDNEVMKEFIEVVENKVSNIAAAADLGLTIRWTQEFSANENDSEAVDEIRHAARQNRYKYEEREAPFKWGEDFGLFTEKFKGAMFGVGSGENCPALHNPDYDFPDKIIPTGVNMFHSIIKNLLK
ncbi:amidohydrolase [Marinoscillum sp. MHG1-6]|uniref:amidohydrolase n=1 Tax=Marinoscillum sp. MHG1-6 TaxID=2959627 RepID=UPI0021570E4E|nr:amidohydrolase [Marinoscillum sp. MHG1-6]